MVVISKRYQFKKVVDTQYSVQHIYPTKQRDVARILEQIPSSVEKVYVFGSSLTLHCGEESDIDLLVIGSKELNEYQAFSNIFKNIENEVDLIIKTQEEFDDNLKIKNSICDVVVKEGLLIYERTLYTCAN